MVGTVTIKIRTNKSTKIYHETIHSPLLEHNRLKGDVDALFQ